MRKPRSRLPRQRRASGGGSNPNKTEAARPPFFIRRSPLLPGSAQPPRCVREQGIDQPCFRGEMAAQRLRPAILACDLVEQPLELGDVAVDRLLEGAVGAVLAGDLVKGLLAGRRIETLGERLALAALVAVPHFGSE